MTRLEAALAAAAAIAGSIAVAFTWQPGLASLFDDSVSYLILAQAFSPFGEPSPTVASALGGSSGIALRLQAPCRLS